uniref:Putative glutathione S-transferase epsilon class member 7 n=1 Tax=Leptinotarsa decemlineata TaxID=7539 RepID=A0A1P8PEW2_LEPDE|nr:putative glutathione S-transferase epsilon class member 7 [Leptinotarsa decemlineata]
MAPTLYGIEGSPPVGAVLLCAKALDLNLNIKPVDLFNLEHLKSDFLALNPQHTVPVLDDDGFILSDSHAINAYLASKYGKDKSLYPDDLKKRAIVDQRLHYDSSTLFPRGLVISKSILFEDATDIPQKNLDLLKEAFEVSEKLLQKEWIAGDQLTIADFSFVTSLTSWTVYIPLSEAEYPKLAAWRKRMESLPYYHVYQQSLDKYVELMKDKVPK